MAKVALITGITGQDGSFLAEFLIEKGYEVHGIMRRSSSFNTGRIEHLYLDEWVRDMKNKRLVNLHWGDMTDSSSLVRIIRETKPDEIYNLAAQSHVKVSFDVPEYTAAADEDLSSFYLGTVRIGAGGATARDNPFLSPFSLWCSETVWFLDYQKLSRELWHVCSEWHFV